MSYIELKEISKSFGERTVLDHFCLSVGKGEFAGIQGESGKGKSTLLNIIGLLEDCEGEIYLNGKKAEKKDRKNLWKHFHLKIGYLFQNFALIDDESVYDNLKIVLEKGRRKEQEEKMKGVLKQVGFSEEILGKKIYQLSGGEQQRIALARIILYDSDIILADEPTGSLDDGNKRIVMEILQSLTKEGKTIIMVSHDKEALEYCSRVVRL